MTNKKKIIYIAITVILTACFAILGAFVFRTSYLRFWETLGELWTSIKFYSCEMFGIENDIVPTVINFSKIFNNDSISIPNDFDSFKADSMSYFDLLFSKENFISWAQELMVGIGVFGKVATIALPALIVVFFAIKQIYGSYNTKHNKDTIPLATFKTISSLTIRPIKRFLADYIAFLKAHSPIWITWLLLWIFNLNLASIIVGFFAYYFYFAMSFRFDTIYTIFVKLGVDLGVVFKSFPWYVLLPCILVVLDKFRQRIATEKLESIGENSIKTKNVKTGATTEIAADCTVLALGVRKNNCLAGELESRPNVFVVGDAQKEGRIAAATQSAFAAAMSLK